MPTEKAEARIQELTQELAQNVEGGVAGFDEDAAVGTMGRISEIMGHHDTLAHYPYSDQTETVKTCLVEAFGVDFANKVDFAKDEDFWFSLEDFMNDLAKFRKFEAEGYPEGDSRAKFLNTLEGARQFLQGRLIHLAGGVIDEEQAKFPGTEDEFWVVLRPKFKEFSRLIVERVKIVDTGLDAKVARLKSFEAEKNAKK